jgi:hypothetical protein
MALKREQMTGHTVVVVQPSLEEAAEGYFVMVSQEYQGLVGEIYQALASSWELRVIVWAMEEWADEHIDPQVIQHPILAPEVERTIFKFTSRDAALAFWNALKSKLFDICMALHDPYRD